MTEPSTSNRPSARKAYVPEPLPDMVGRPEVSKGLFGDLFKRKRKSRGKDQKSETRA